MNRIPTLLILPIALLAGCASKASMDAAYDASLQRWQGATRAELEAKWGKPTLVQAAADGGVLTWIVRNDSPDHDLRAAAPQVVVANTGSGTTVANTGALGAAVVPVTCTTRFTMKDGRVASWKFEGLGCGAPY